MRRVVVIVVLAACWRSSPPAKPPEPVADKSPPPPPSAPAPSPIEELLQLMQRFADDMCTCQDSSCAARIADEMTKWSQEQSAKQAEPPEWSEDERKRAAAIGVRMGHCMVNAMSASAPGSATP